ncbi:MAG TPA: hypothetical protein VMI75_13580 [Polyangiaceae bacterium]|nr:hypothetical protein [Polyangiaceae bacterium]
MKGYTSKPPPTFAHAVARLCRRQKSLAMGAYVTRLFLRAERKATLQDVAEWLRRESKVRYTNESAEALRAAADLLEKDEVFWDNIHLADRMKIYDDIAREEEK